jgi:hypothetical protein
MTIVVEGLRYELDASRLWGRSTHIAGTGVRVAPNEIPGPHEAFPFDLDTTPLL